MLLGNGQAEGWEVGRGGGEGREGGKEENSSGRYATPNEILSHLTQQAG